MAEFFATYYPRRRAIKEIKEAGATSEDTAKTSEELGMDESFLQYLASMKDIKKTRDRRYYIPCEDRK
ncbi:MAG: hypothetical protein QHH24_01740 [Candidatus Bathyarchaeota archaeon]|jgi:hypothetical protein|nr:hypothetical protein [Candidatus Bathyarchaeota archaeon]